MPQNQPTGHQHRLGLIGAGHIGSLMANDLSLSGHKFTAFDRNIEGLRKFEENGARIAQSPLLVAQEADLIGICVRTADEIREVMEGPEGILAAGRTDITIAIHSTISIRELHGFAGVAKSAGIRIIDAPVSRGADAPVSKGIIFMAGGEESDVAHFEPYMLLCGAQTIRAGALGAGMAMKLCNNIVYYANKVLAYDVVRFSEAAGVDVAQLAELITSNGATSALAEVLERRGGKPLPGHLKLFSAQTFAVLGEKDLDCAIEAAGELNLDLPALRMTRTVFAEAISALHNY